MKVAVFGAGTMGSGIAQVFAAKGHTALMYASSVASAQKHKDKLVASLAKRVAKGKMTQEAVDALLANVLVEEKSAWVINRLDAIVRHLDIPTSLKSFGVPESDLEGLVESGMQVQRLLVNNMRPVTPEDARAIYEQIL